MRAIVHEKYGPPEDVLKLRDIDMPAVGDDEVLVRVRATSVHADVWHVVTGLPYVLRLMGNGLRKPKKLVPGMDLGGHVERVGRNVTRFAPGDEVFGGTGVMRGWQNGGTFAEYVAIHQDNLALKPACVTFEQAAAAEFSGEIAMGSLGPVDQLARRHVLINGAGGAVGTLAIQMAKAAGAQVTGVDCAEKLAMIRQLGADHVIDYAKEDFTQGGVRYDRIVDVASTLKLDDCRRALTSPGVYVIIGHAHFGRTSGRVLGEFPRFFGVLARSPFDKNLPKLTSPKMIPGMREILERLKTLLESGSLTPVIARTFPLNEVAEAMRWLVEGRGLGRLIITP
jgi:NADPH:quinone reductase-like Zn-dependent oxidoreductase